MNINKVYIADIYRLEDRKFNKFATKVNNGRDFNFYTDDFMVNKCVFVKKSLVYYSYLLGQFVDLETGEWYNVGYPNSVGELFIDISISKIYGKDLMRSDKKYYTKKKILKKYDEYKGRNINECK